VLAYLLQRVALIPLLMLGVSLLLFALVQLVPGDPVALLVPEGELDPAQRERIIRNLGLDQPAHVQYLAWLSGWVRGDWGFAFSRGVGVREAILEALPVTLQLQGLALLLALAVALPVGVLAAVRRYSWFDNLATVGTLFGISMPDFWLGLSLMMIFSVSLGWLPSTGMGEGEPVPDRAAYFVMPVLVLATANLAVFTRFTRTSVLDVLSQNYITTARAKGVAEARVLVVHAVRNALIPVITVVGLSVTRLLGGSVIVESVFGWPGLGRLALGAVLSRDISLILGITMVAAALVMLVNLAVDLAYGVANPRIRLRDSRA
jgi:peptide/nickel transport system permease protein